MHCLRFTAVLFGLALSACASLSTVEIDGDHLRRSPYGGDVKAEADALALPLIERGHTPGMVIGVLLPDGSSRVFGYGVTRAGGPAPDGDTLFAIGSLSKGFLGALAATLVEEGRLSWDEPLEQLLAPGTILSPDARRITLLQLATHTSGLPRQPLTPETLMYFLRYLFTGESFYQHVDLDYVLDFLQSFHAPARTDFEYSNIGYALLGHVIERRAGATVAELTRTRLTGPLGLGHTTFIPERHPGWDARALGHAGDQPKFIKRGEPVPDWRFTEVMQGAAAMYSSARDLLAYAGAHLGRQDDRLHAAMRDTLSVRLPRDRESAAVAWIADDFDGVHLVYQIGLVAGYSTYVGLDPKRRTAVVVLQNAFNWNIGTGKTLLLRLAQE